MGDVKLYTDWKISKCSLFSWLVFCRPLNLYQANSCFKQAAFAFHWNLKSTATNQTKFPFHCILQNKKKTSLYEGCSNMNASSFITFFTYMLRQNIIPFWKELFLAFKMAPNMKKQSLYFSSYRPLFKGHSCILKFFWSKLQCTFWYMCGYSVISL